MKTSILAAWVALLALFLATYGGWKYYQVQRFQQREALAEERLPPLEEFELTERSGRSFRSSDMRGKVWVVTLFFSTCPGTCAKLNANIQYMNSLEDLKDVTWVSISVDPVTDTLPVLREYADRHNADPERWLFVRGDFDYIKRVGEDYLKQPVIYKDHRDTAVVIDKKGQIAGFYNAISNSDSKRMRAKLKELLAEPWSPETQPDVREDQATTAKSDEKAEEASEEKQPPVDGAASQAKPGEETPSS